jgi:hypothetical protein
MSMVRKSSQEDYFSEFETWYEGIERLLHGLYGNLSKELAEAILISLCIHPYHGSTSGNTGTTPSYTSKSNTAETSIANLLDHLESVFQR